MNQTWASMHERCLEHALYTPRDSSAEVTRAEKKSERIRFQALFWSMATERARDRGLQPNSPEAWEMVHEANEIGKAIADPFLKTLEHLSNPNIVKKRNQLRLEFIGDPTKMLSAWDLQDIGFNFPASDELEAAVANYFDSSWRSNSIDRFALRLLLERELACFIHEMARKDPFFGSTPNLTKARAILKRTLFGQSLKILLWTLAILIFTVILTKALNDQSEASLLAPATAVTLIGLTWFGISMYHYLTSVTKSKKAASTLLNMSLMATEVLIANKGNSPMVISAFRRDLERLRDAGFLLPSTLFGVMDEFARKGVDRI